MLTLPPQLLNKLTIWGQNSPEPRFMYKLALTITFPFHSIVCTCNESLSPFAAQET